MALFLFRSGEDPTDYCATDTRSGHKLPPLKARRDWQYHAELQNPVHAAVFGVMNFEAAKLTIARHGYLRYSASRFLRNAT
jgi:hypothetical protein